MKLIDVSNNIQDLDIKNRIPHTYRYKVHNGFNICNTIFWEIEYYRRIEL